MKLTPCQTKEQLSTVEALYMRAFPREERKPFSVILEKAEEGSMEILTIEEENTFLGLAITILFKDRVILDYLAISEDKRGQSVGTKTLAQLKERYAGKRLIIEIEDPDEPAENTSDRIRRKNFYLRNGLLEMPFRILLFGVRMQVLCTERIFFEEYHEIFPAVFSERAAKNVILL